MPSGSSETNINIFTESNSIKTETYSGDILSTTTNTDYGVELSIDSKETIETQYSDILSTTTNTDYGVELSIDSKETIETQYSNILPATETEVTIISEPEPTKMWKDYDTGGGLKDVEFTIEFGIDHSSVDNDDEYNYTIYLNNESVQTGSLNQYTETTITVKGKHFTDRENNMDMYVDDNYIIIEDELITVYNEDDIELKPVLKEVTPSEPFEEIDDNVYIKFNGENISNDVPLELPDDYTFEKEYIVNLNEGEIMNNTGDFPGTVDFEIPTDDLDNGENPIKIEFVEE